MLIRHMPFIKKKPPTIAYWEWRAAQYGRRSVFSLGHPEEELDEITAHQKKEIYPFFLELLMGDEKIALDLGCGTGRFTSDIAQMIGGKAVGIDPVCSLLAMASKKENVEYRLMEPGSLPFPEDHFDVVWICLVLGGMNGALLERTVYEIKRVLKKDGLLFLVENTSLQKNSDHWWYRDFQEHKRILDFVSLRKLHDYCDVNERITIMAGRKHCIE